MITKTVSHYRKERVTPCFITRFGCRFLFFVDRKRVTKNKQLTHEEEEETGKTTTAFRVTLDTLFAQLKQHRLLLPASLFLVKSMGENNFLLFLEKHT